VSLSASTKGLERRRLHRRRRGGKDAVRGGRLRGLPALAAGGAAAGARRDVRQRRAPWAGRRAAARALRRCRGSVRTQLLPGARRPGARIYAPHGQHFFGSLHGLEVAHVQTETFATVFETAANKKVNCAVIRSFTDSAIGVVDDVKLMTKPPVAAAPVGRVSVFTT
jgi:hypothetical protein